MVRVFNRTLPRLARKLRRCDGHGGGAIARGLSCRSSR